MVVTIQTVLTENYSTPHTITYNGVAFTPAASSYGTYRRTYVYYLLNPAQGTNSMVINLYTFSNRITHYRSVMTLNDVNTGNAIASFVGNNNTTSIALPGSDVGEMSINSMVANSPGALGAGQTNIYSGYNWVSSYKEDGDPMSIASGSDIEHCGVRFKTWDPPTVTTGTISDLFQFIGEMNTNNVTSAGDGTVTERGVVVSTSTEPTISDTKFTTAGTTGAYDTSMSSLNAGTLYYCRAFATSEYGTVYGDELSFKTDENKAGMITISTDPITFT